MKTAFAFLILLLLAGCASRTAQIGDTVHVTYAGRFENGTLFDTNDPALRDALGGGPLTKFTPITVTLGEGAVVPGFEQAIYGMREGQTKSVLVKAVDAYGGYDPGKVLELPEGTVLDRQIALERTLVVPRASLGTRGAADMRVGSVINDTDFSYNVTALNATEATLRIVSVRQANVRFGNPQLLSALVSENGTSLVFRRIASVGDQVNTTFGPYVVDAVDASHISLTSPFRLGDQVRAKAGMGIVKRRDNGTVVIDFNHPLAGLALNFTVTLVKIEEK